MLQYGPNNSWNKNYLLQLKDFLYDKQINYHNINLFKSPDYVPLEGPGYDNLGNDVKNKTQQIYNLFLTNKNIYEEIPNNTDDTDKLIKWKYF